MNNKLSGTFRFGSLVRFSLPTVVMMVFLSLYSMVDGIFVARLIGTDALSAVNIVYPLLSVVIAAGVMLATGGSAVVARKMGAGHGAEARQDFTLILLTGLAVGLAITGLGLLFLNPLLRFLGADGAIWGMCREYAFVLLFFSAPGMLQMLFQTFFVTAGRPGVGLGVTGLGGLANIVLDYVFIGRLGWGVAGAALATGIGFSIPALFGLVWFSLRRREPLHFSRPVWRGGMLLHTLANGSSEMVTNLSTAVITLLFNLVMMRYYGPDGVAAITIIMYAEFLLTAIYLGYSTGIAPIVSYSYGEGNLPQLRRIFRISLRLILASSLLVFAGALFFARDIVGIFTTPASPVFPLAVRGFYLYAVCYLFKGVNIFASALFTALSDGVTSAVLSLLRTLVFIVAGMQLLPLALGVDGVWLAVPFAELLSVALSVFCFRTKLLREWHAQEKKEAGGGASGAEAEPC